MSHEQKTPDAITAEANARAAVAAARSAEAKAKVDELAAEKAEKDAAAPSPTPSGLIPDFSKLTPTTTTPGDEPLLGDSVAQASLARAAHEVSTRVAKALAQPALASADNTESAGEVAKPAPWHIFITSDTALVDSEATYYQVADGLRWLSDLAAGLIAPKTPDDEHQKEGILPLTLIPQLAAAVPGILSLFSSQRTITSAKVDANDIAASAAVAGAFLAGHPDSQITHDDIRLLSASGAITAALSHLNEQRQQLAGIAALRKSALEKRADAAVSAIDSFIAAITTVPSGSTRSPLTVALIREALHAPDDGKRTFVLVLKSQGGASSTVEAQRPVGKAHFSTLSALSLTYFLLEVGNDSLLAAGTVVGTASISGEIGAEITIRTNLAPFDS